MTRNMRRMSRCLAAPALVTTLLTGCGSGADPTSGVGGTVTVFAAASLTESFTTLGDQFEDAHPGTEVVFSFAGSSSLARQIGQGAPADVFASAAPRDMRQVADSGDITAEPVVFAHNRLEIAVPSGNPADIGGLADLARPEPRIALCAEQVPCGAAAETVFRVAGLTPQPDTREADVKAVLTKVRLGEVDAALVYRTDVRAAQEQVDGIEFPESAEAVNDYPIAPVAAAPNPDTAAAFLDYVRSEQSRSVLADAGFDTP